MITTLSVAFAVLVIRLHYTSPETSPPQWMRVLIFRYLSRLVGMDYQQRFSRLLHGPKPRGRGGGGDEDGANRPCRDMTISDAMTDEVRSDCNAYTPDNVTTPGVSCRRLSRESYELTLRHNSHAVDCPPNTDARLRYTVGSSTLGGVQGVGQGQCKLYETLDGTLVGSGAFPVNEWRKMAEILDRFCFWMFLVFLVVPTASILGIMRLFKPVL